MTLGLITITLGKLLLFVLIVSLAITFPILKLIRGKKTPIISFLQNYSGVLFIVSGVVKAIDPLGTAYKMEQYYAEFESVFSQTWLNFLAPMFPYLSEHSVSSSVVMIVLEIVLGICLIVGWKPKLTAWAFFLLIAVFTFLTGFTYLTGYVPEGVNFFDFGNWGEYVKTNMKVTDCGCFGDFLKLEPFVSFCKDLALLVPALAFLFWNKNMHQIFTPNFRNILTGLTLAITTVFCLSNFVWDIPTVDFRPFYEGQNVRAQKAAEIKAEEEREITHYKMENKKDGKVVTIPFDQYMKEFKKYPKEDWKLEQIRTEPAVPPTKISEFEMSTPSGEDGTEELLSDENYNFWVVSYKIPNTSSTSKIMVKDTTWQIDTILQDGSTEPMIVNSISEIKDKEISKTVFSFDDSFIKLYTDIVNPIAEAAEKDGFKTRLLTKYEDPAMLEDFRHTAQTAYPLFTGDDILLKTIVRSNPGIMLMKDGTIIKKWHIDKVPSYEEIKSKYMK